MKSEKKSESAKKRWSNPEQRKAKSDAMKKYWKDKKDGIRNTPQEAGKTQ